MKKYCLFPDQTKVEIQSIFDVSEGYTNICYISEELPQVLWVPNDFVINE